jgi:hypothetical protein
MSFDDILIEEEEDYYTININYSIKMINNLNLKKPHQLSTLNQA